MSGPASPSPNGSPTTGPAAPAPSTSRLRAWLELIRIPNAFTVPGDLLAGLFLALAGMPSDTAVPWRDFSILLGASFCFYFAGMILNDAADIEEDRRDRPHRPIPSGRISAMAAVNATGILMLGGIGACAFVSQQALAMAAVLCACIVSYNLFAKKILVFGPLAMGLCRGCNFLLGVSCLPGEVAFSNPVTTGFQSLVVYVAFVTMLARDETTPRNPYFKRVLPALTLVVGYIGMLFANPSLKEGWGVIVFALIAGTSAFLAFDAARCMKVLKRVTPPVVGQLLANLMLIQATFIAAAGRPLIAVALLILWPASRWTRKRFYAS